MRTLLAKAVLLVPQVAQRQEWVPHQLLRHQSAHSVDPLVHCQLHLERPEHQLEHEQRPREALKLPMKLRVSLQEVPPNP